MFSSSFTVLLVEAIKKAIAVFASSMMLVTTNPSGTEQPVESDTILTSTKPATEETSSTESVDETDSVLTSTTPVTDVLGSTDELNDDSTIPTGTESSEDASSESSEETSIETIVTDTDFEASDWTDETHSKSAEPNFAEVFDDTQVKRLDFVVTEERWQSMLDDMTSNYGEFGSKESGAGTRPNGEPGVSPEGAPDGVPEMALGDFNMDPNADPAAFPTGEEAAFGAPDGMPNDMENTGGGNLIQSEEDPIFVPADVYYNGTQWYRVGIRFKGNSTLQGSWQSGISKLSFKLDFDEFEDDYPQIDNQRFFGFKKFSLKNNYFDGSQLREKVAADVFKKAGLAVSHTAFYTLYVDHGNGPEYFGLYTLVEEVDGTVLDTQFSSDDGNLYKPEDGSANFVEGTFSSENFEKKTNEDDEDWSDIEALFAALHDETATTAPETWRENLEAVFDVDGFLKYLAVNGIIQNWDTYGRMTHNFYLYNNPETEKLTWIPWDNNEALQEGKQGGALALDFSNLTEGEWPLIEKIYADEVYRARYNNYLFEVMSSAFETSSMQATYENYKELVAPYATTELPGYSFTNNADDFYSAVETLQSHASDRASAVETYLNMQ